MNFWKLIVEKFSQMPKWVQVVTWFVMLALIVYLYISPRFINGQIVVAMDNGGTIEYRGATLRTYIEGRVLKYQANEEGFWSIPVVSRLPQTIRLQVYHEDAHAWYDVNIDKGTVWANSMGKSEIRLLVKNNPPKVETQITRLARDRSQQQDIFTALADIVESAWAADNIPQQSSLSKDKISQKLSSILAKATGRIQSGASANFALTGKEAPAYSQKLMIIDSAEKEFKVKIPDEEWRTMSTSGDLADYIYKVQQKTRR